MMRTIKSLIPWGAFALALLVFGFLVWGTAGKGFYPQPKPVDPHFCGDGPIRSWSIAQSAERLDYQILSSATTEGGLLSDSIRSTEMTAQGVLIGYAGELADNLSFLTPTTIETCQSGELHVSGHVNDIYYDQVHSEIWVATDGQGTYRFAQGKWKNYTTLNGLTDNRQYSLAVDQQGLLYVSTWEGISVYNRDADTWSRVAELYNSQLSNHIHTMLLTKNDGVWLGTINAGVNRLLNGKWTNFGFSDEIKWPDLVIVPQLGSNNVRVLAQAPDGKIWVGGDPGLAVYNPSTGVWTAPGEAQKNLNLPLVASAIQFDQQGQAWVAGYPSTWVVSAEQVSLFSEGGLALSLGVKNGVVGESVVVLGRAQGGMFIGTQASEVK